MLNRKNIVNWCIKKESTNKNILSFLYLFFKNKQKITEKSWICRL